MRALSGATVYAVGEATAEAARAAGFEVAATGDGDAKRLLGSLDADLRLLHLCGEDRSATDARQRITPLAVYRARPIERPDLGSVGGGVALVHSPRAGRRLAELVADRATIAIAAISDAAAAAAGTGWQALERAERPSDEALLALAARLCDTPAPE